MEKALRYKKINQDNKRNNSLIRASSAGRNDTVAMLLESGANANAKDNEGRTALTRAIVGGNSETVKLLLENGADPNKNGDDGWTPLMIAISRGHTRKIVRVLLENGADVNTKTNDNYTVLMWAAMEREPDIVSMLLKRGADVNVKDTWNNNTVLVRARNTRHTEIVTLIENHIRRDKIMKETKMTSLVIKKGLTPKGDNPLMPYAHREMIYRIASFF